MHSIWAFVSTAALQFDTPARHLNHRLTHALCLPACRELASSGKGRVFTTDAVLTALMCMRSSIYSWDVVATRKGDQLFLDWRVSADCF